MSNPITPSSDEIQATGQQEAAETRRKYHIDQYPNLVFLRDNIISSASRSMDWFWMNGRPLSYEFKQQELWTVFAVSEIAPFNCIRANKALQNLMKQLWRVHDSSRGVAVECAANLIRAFSEAHPNQDPNLFSDPEDE